MYYNVRIKTYPDGHKQYFWSENPIFRLDEEIDFPELVESVKRKRRQSKLRREIQSFDREEDIEDDDVSYLRSGRNIRRTVNEVYDIARSNEFNWFINLTLSDKYVNRYDYCSCADAVKKFTDRLRKLGCKWLIVPEQHKDGAYHFHGLVQGDLPLTPSGKTCYNKADGIRLPIYNLANYEYGFTNVTQIMHPKKTASYIAKYLTKQIAVPKGKKCYWASKSLARPTVEYLSTTEKLFVHDPDEGCDVMIDYQDPAWAYGYLSGIRYVKEIESEYGRFVISEE